MMLLSYSWSWRDMVLTQISMENKRHITDFLAQSAWFKSSYRKDKIALGLALLFYDNELLGLCSMTFQKP